MHVQTLPRSLPWQSPKGLDTMPLDHAVNNCMERLRCSMNLYIIMAIQFLATNCLYNYIIIHITI